MFEKSAIGMLSIDEKGSVTDVNDYLLGIFGISSKNVLKNNYNLFQDKNIDDKTKQKIKEGKNINFIKHLDLSQLKEKQCDFGIKRSGVIDIEIVVTPYVYTEEQSGQFAKEYLIMVQDISEQTVFEKILDNTFEKLTGVIDELKENVNELEISNNELDQFASVVSHDLKRPLISILSFLELLETEFEGKIDDETFIMFTDVKKRAKRMSDMIDNLLSYSRLTVNTDNFRLCDSKDIIKSAVDNLLTDIEQNKAEIIYNQSLPKIMADEIQMISVFQNLISNGIKFCGNHTPKIHISVEKTNIIDMNNTEYTFSIQDNGIGFDSYKYGARIFGMFKRLNKNGKYQGNGIGLAFCKKIIDRHNGRIWVKSEIGKGATFYFTLKGI